MVSFQTLHWTHLGAGIAHALQAAESWTLSATSYKNHGKVQLTNDSYQTQIEPTGWELRRLGKSYHLGYMVGAVPLLSSLQHIWSFMDRERYEAMIQKGYNPVRWFEYTFSAGLMFWIIAQLSNISDIKALSSLLFSNGVLQGLGFLSEKMATMDSLGLAESVRWLQVFGFVLFLGMFGMISIGFISAVSENASIPGAIYGIIIGLFFAMLSFGIWHAVALQQNRMFHTKAQSKPPRFSKNAVEMGYLCLSFVAKTFLTQTTLFGVFARQPTALSRSLEF